MQTEVSWMEIILASAFATERMLVGAAVQFIVFTIGKNGLAMR